MEDQAVMITCSAPEMIVLASLLGADTLLGVDDPFAGWLADEIEQAGQQARGALAERRFIQVQPDGGIVMDVAVAAMIGTCAFPDASFALTCTPIGGETTVHYFHVPPHLAVEQVVSAEPASACRVIALEGAQAAYRRIVELFRLDRQQAAGDFSSPGELTEVSLMKARELAVIQGQEAAQKALQEDGLDASIATALAETLAHPIANGALVAMARREMAWEIAGLGVLEGHNGLWRLRAFRRGGENWVEAIPCDAAGACQAIRQVMNRLLPEPLSAR